MKIMKRFTVLLILILFLTGCGIIQTETREGILLALEEESYINSEEYTDFFENRVTDLIPHTINYTYIYEDKFGDNYVVEIYPKNEEDFYKVKILEDVEIKISTMDDRKYVSDYDIKTELLAKKDKKVFKIY